MTSPSGVQLQELVLSSSAFLTALHDVKTGSLLTAFKQSASTGGAVLLDAATLDISAAGSSKGKGRATTSEIPATWRQLADVVEGRDGQGGVVVAALPGGKGALNVWSFQREAPMHRLLIPVKPNCLALSKNGVYLAVGAQDGRILLWEIATGLLVASFDAHYRSVSALAWTDDSAAFVSGADDGACHVWSLPIVLAAANEPLLPVAPYMSLSDHSLPITSISIGLGRFPNIRCLTSALDGSAKLWDLFLPSVPLITTFALPAPLLVTHVQLDTLERCFFAASLHPKSGLSQVWKVDLYRRVRPGDRDVQAEAVEQHQRRNNNGNEQSDGWEAIGGGGRGESEVVQAANDRTSIPGRIYALPATTGDAAGSASTETISSMHLSALSSTLLIGTSHGNIRILSLPSLQPIRAVSPAQSSSTSSLASPITFIRCLLRPEDLVSRTGQASNTGRDDQAVQPRTVAQQLSRTLVTPYEFETAPQERVIPMRITRKRRVDADLIPPLPAFEQYLPQSSPDILTLARPGDESNGSDALGAAEQENVRLREQLARAVALNERMWESLVDKKMATFPPNGYTQ